MCLSVCVNVKMFVSLVKVVQVVPASTPGWRPIMHRAKEDAEEEALGACLFYFFVLQSPLTPHP